MCREGREGDMQRGRGKRGHLDMEGRKCKYTCTCSTTLFTAGYSLQPLQAPAMKSGDKSVSQKRSGSAA